MNATTPIYHIMPQDEYHALLRKLEVVTIEAAALHTDNRKLLNRAETAEMDAQIAEQAVVTLDAELNEVAAERDALKSAANWVLNVASGVGKSGGPPSHDEYVNALDALKAVLDVSA